MNQRGVDPKFLCVRGGAREMGGADGAHAAADCYAHAHEGHTPRSLAAAAASPTTAGGTSALR